MSPLLQTLGAASVRAFGFTRGSAGGGGAMTLISTQVLASTATSVTFSSIPQTYKHLQLRVTTRTADSTTAYVYYRFNGDSGANYPGHNLQGTPTQATSGWNGAAAGILLGQSASTPTAANIFGAAIIDILDYTSTSKNKTARALNGFANNDIELSSGVWLSTAAITSITFYNGGAGSNYQIGSRFSLYGVLG